MKKIYLKPETSCAVTNTEWALCTAGGTAQNGEQTSNPGLPPLPTPAPKRNVF